MTIIVALVVYLDIVEKVRDALPKPGRVCAMPLEQGLER